MVRLHPITYFITKNKAMKKQAFLSQRVIDNYRITIVVKHLEDGWKERTVLLPEGVTMYGNSAQRVAYKHDFPFTKIKYRLFGQERVCELYCAKEIADGAILQNL